MAEWVGVANVTIPAAAPEETANPLQLGLLYGVVFGGLLILIVIALTVILSLKYVQVTRRESDKGELHTHSLTHLRINTSY